MTDPLSNFNSPIEIQLWTGFGARVPAPRCSSVDWKSLPSALVCLLVPCLGAADRAIRSTVGTVVSVLFQLVRVAGWPELLQALLQCLYSNDLNHMEGALDAIYKIFPDDVSLNETFDMLKSSCWDFHLADTPFLGCVVRLIQHQILLCTARRLMFKDAKKSRHSFEYSERDKMVTVHLVGGIDAFIEVPLNWPHTSA